MAQVNINIPPKGFYLIIDQNGNLQNVGDENGPWNLRPARARESGQKAAFPFKNVGEIEAVKNDITFLHVRNSPGRWCVIGGQERWCP